MSETRAKFTHYATHQSCQKTNYVLQFLQPQNNKNGSSKKSLKQATMIPARTLH